MKFYKVEAAGNDFVLLDLNEARLAPPSPRRIAQICDRHFGIGADGVILSLRSSKPKWKFFNNDGSEAEFCGNAARAFTLYLLGRSGQRKVSFDTRIGKITGQLIKKGVSPVLSVEVPLTHGDVLEIPRAIENEIKTRLPHARFAYLNTGVPHLVLGVKKLPTMETRNLTSRLLYDHRATPPKKWNLTWLEIPTGKVVTWERGVEAETLACGSGALAALLALESWNFGKSTKTLHFPGGALKVKRLGLRSLSLTGPARIVFSGVIK